MSGGGGGAGGPGDRRHDAPGDDIPRLVLRAHLMHNLDLPQHLLLIQNAAPQHLRRPRPNSGASHRKVYGGDVAGEEVHGAAAVEGQPQPRAFQYKGARDNYCNGQRRSHRRWSGCASDGNYYGDEGLL